MTQFIFETAPLLYAGVFILGSLIGSFLNVVILRMPAILEYEWRCQCADLLNTTISQGDKKPPGIVFSRSRCPGCGHILRFWENIPVVSYLFLNGKCSKCNSRISLRYPLVELATAILFVLTVWHFGPNLQGLTALLLTSFLIILAGIDLDTQLLPDVLTFPLMWAGILLSFWSIHADLASSVLGAVTGYLVLWTIYHLFRILTGKEGMGYGDFKLLAALGAWLGWQALPMLILISSVLGALAGLSLMATGKLKKGRPMPFGPFIALAGWIVLIWGEHILRLYFSTGNFH